MKWYHVYRKDEPEITPAVMRLDEYYVKYFRQRGWDVDLIDKPGLYPARSE